MADWPAWQRWGAWLLGWALYVLAFGLLFSASGTALRVLALVAIGAGMVVLAYASRAVVNERMRSVDRRQLSVVLPAMLAYMLMMLYVFPRALHVDELWLKAALVLSPMLPLLLVAWAMVRYVNHCDELERRQHLEAAGIAMVVVGLASVALGFLAAAGLVKVQGTLVLLLVFPALCIPYGLACAWNKWRNRAR